MNSLDGAWVSMSDSKERICHSMDGFTIVCTLDEGAPHQSWERPPERVMGYCAVGAR